MMSFDWCAPSSPENSEWHRILDLMRDLAMNRRVGRFDGNDFGPAAFPSPDRSSLRTKETVRHQVGEDNSWAVENDFFACDEALRSELEPSTLLEQILADRVIAAMWRLRSATARENGGGEEADSGPVRAAARRSARSLAAAGREVVRAERGLERTLRMYYEACERRPFHWGPSRPLDPTSSPRLPQEYEDDPETARFSNEWPVVSTPESPLKPEEQPESRARHSASCERWQDRLVFDFNVSETSPVVKGTWVTVNHVVSLIVDSWTWSDILRTHPELTEEDIRTCLSYTVAQDRGEGV